MQPSLEFTLPIAGRHPASRHASASGAQRAVRDRGALALAYRQLLIEAGPLSDPEAAQVLGRPLSSVCSTRNGWGSRVGPSGEYELTAWSTRRTKWRWQD